MSALFRNKRLMLDKIATPNLSIYLSFFISTEHSLGGNNAVQNEKT